MVPTQTERYHMRHDDPVQPESRNTQVAPTGDCQRAILKGRPVEELLGVAVMAALVAITLVNVLVRYFSNQSFAWTEEISVFLLVVMTLAGAATAAADDVHIRIEFFYASGSRRRRQWLAALSALATALLFLLLVVLIARTAWSEFEFGETTSGLGVPRWWYSALLPFLALMVALRAIAGFRRRARSAGGTAVSIHGEPS